MSAGVEDPIWDPRLGVQAHVLLLLHPPCPGMGCRVRGGLRVWVAWLLVLMQCLSQGVDAREQKWCVPILFSCCLYEVFIFRIMVYLPPSLSLILPLTSSKGRWLVE